MHLSLALFHTPPIISYNSPHFTTIGDRYLEATHYESRDGLNDCFQECFFASSRHRPIRYDIDAFLDHFKQKVEGSRRRSPHRGRHPEVEVIQIFTLHI
jgi:hypothetical protein